jgi:hypothetical protein
MRYLLPLFLIACFFCYADAQPATKVIHFKELQKFLPAAAPAGFVKGKPKGQTVSASGIATSNASIEFTAQRTERQLRTNEDGSQDSADTEVTWSASVEITDHAGMGEAVAASLMMMNSVEMDNETEEGYERSTPVLGYKGLERSHSAEQSRSCSIQITVGNRFMVTASGSGFSDPSVLKELLGSMDLKKLESAQ